MRRHESGRRAREFSRPVVENADPSTATPETGNGLSPGGGRGGPRGAIVGTRFDGSAMDPRRVTGVGRFAWDPTANGLIVYAPQRSTAFYVYMYKCKKPNVARTSSGVLTCRVGY